MGCSATHGTTQSPPRQVDAVVTYTDRWMWDITMYMLRLDKHTRNLVTRHPPYMKRRSFLSLSALSAVSIPAVKAAEDAEAPDARWFETINREALRYKAVSDEGKLVLQVELIQPAAQEVTEIKDEKGELRCYRFRGKDLPSRYWPGCSLLTRFDLTWDGKAMNIPGRFWNDLPGLQIETSTLDPETLKPELQWKARQFLDQLEQPRVILSADGGTVLIEWVRPEECDSRSTIRWIISKSGTVLRHRHEPPHEC
jgi:hypothetical protein